MKARTVYRLSTGFLACLTVFNVVLAVIVFRRMKSPVHLNVEYHEPTVVQMPAPFTNQAPHALDVSAQKVETSPLPPVSQPRVYPMEYRYFEANGEPCALLNGKYLHEGGVHAFGRILKLFPERIYFESGEYIENQIRKEVVGHVSSSSGSDTVH